MKKIPTTQADHHTLLSIANLLAIAQTPKDLLNTLCHTTPKLDNGIKIISVFLSDHKGQETFNLQALHINTPNITPTDTAHFYNKNINEIILKSASKNTPIHFNLVDYCDTTLLGPGDLPTQTLAGIAIPFSAVQSNQRAVLILGHNPDHPPSLDTLQLLTEFLNLSGVMLDSIQKNKYLQELATFDHLTGLLNRRAISEILDREHGRAERHDRRYSILFLDIDNFKMINDIYGHNIGDEALKEIALNASDILREGDWIGRWGGEEFICVLPDTCEKGAENIATRLCHKITRSQLVTRNHQISLTLSIGIASYPIDGANVQALLNHADEGLLQAKTSGKNCAKRQTPRPHPPRRNTPTQPQ